MIHLPDLVLSHLLYLVGLPEASQLVVLNRNWESRSLDIWLVLYQLMKKHNTKRSGVINSSHSEKFTHTKKVRQAALTEYHLMLHGQSHDWNIMHGDNSSYWTIIRMEDLVDSYAHCHRVCWFDVSQSFYLLPGKYGVSVFLTFWDPFREKMNYSITSGDDQTSQLYKKEIIELSQLLHWQRKIKVPLEKEIEIKTPQQVFLRLWKHSGHWVSRVRFHGFFWQPQI